MKHRNLKIAGALSAGLSLVLLSVMFLSYHTGESSSFMERFRARNEAVILLLPGLYMLRLAMIWSKREKVR